MIRFSNIILKSKFDSEILLFKSCLKKMVSHLSSSVDDNKNQSWHMLNDLCFVVNEYDEVQSIATKKDCHMKPGLLHRAFSLFLFRPSLSNPYKLELLLQQRSNSKITFPLLWSNTCCSHPCSNKTNESDENNAIGVKIASQRKMTHELGIDSARLPTANITYLTRIIYSAENEPADGLWVEKELDYLLVSILSDSTDYKHLVNLNKDEVAATLWCDFEAIQSSNNQLKSSGFRRFTPWFRKLIDSNYLSSMWKWAELQHQIKSQNASPEILTEFKHVDASWDRLYIQRL